MLKIFQYQKTRKRPIKRQYETSRAKKRPFYFVSKIVLHQKNCSQICVAMYRRMKKKIAKQQREQKILFKEYHYVHLFLSAVFQLNYKDPEIVKIFYFFSNIQQIIWTIWVRVISRSKRSRSKRRAVARHKLCHYIMFSRVIFT